jgi:hypothetical protein
MNSLRTLALAAAPTALLIGLAGPASAAHAPAPKASAACKAPAADAVLTAKQGIELYKGCKSVKAPRKTWHWMGNYGSVYDVVRVANSRNVGAGGLVTEANASGGGLIPTFMYY